jgi:hypothetical protein
LTTVGTSHFIVSALVATKRIEQTGAKLGQPKPAKKWKKRLPALGAIAKIVVVEMRLSLDAQTEKSIFLQDITKGDRQAFSSVANH